MDMANRSYLYTLDIRPKSYADRPGSIIGLTEFAYAVPTLSYLLVSDDTALCPSLLFDSDISIFAVCGRTEIGLRRAYHLLDMLAGGQKIANREPLRLATQEMRGFLDQRRLPFMYLEVAEIDMMQVDNDAGIRAAAEQHARTARELGAWVDQLTPDQVDLAMAAGGAMESVFDHAGNYDQMRGSSPPPRPIGMGFWSDVLYYRPLNAAEWAVKQSR
jgi:hypothetical protein